MENEQVPASVNIPTPVAIAPPTTPIAPLIQPAIIPSSQPSKLPIFILVVLLILSIGGMAYLYIQNQSLRVAPPVALASPIPAQVVPTPPATTSPVAPTATWKKYVSPTKVEISYPEDWVLKASADSTWIKEEGPSIALSNGNNKITIDFPTDFGPGLCIFKDEAAFPQDPSQGEMMAGSKCPGDFVEIKGQGSMMRRLVKPNASMESNGITTWSIYTKDSDGFFASNPPIFYKVPDNFKATTITLMDQIIATLKTVK